MRKSAVISLTFVDPGGSCARHAQRQNHIMSGALLCQTCAPSRGASSDWLRWESPSSISSLQRSHKMRAQACTRLAPAGGVRPRTASWQFSGRMTLPLYLSLCTGLQCEVGAANIVLKCCLLTYNWMPQLKVMLKSSLRLMLSLFGRH